MGVKISALTETTTMADANTLPTDTTSGTRRISWANIKTAIFGAINGLTSKSTPVGADVIAIGDSAASYAGKKVTLAEAGIVKTYITAQASASRVTGAAPDAIGEYRSYLRTRRQELTQKQTEARQPRRVRQTGISCIMAMLSLLRILITSHQNMKSISAQGRRLFLNFTKTRGARV